MTREIILVTLIDGEELNLEKSKAFTNTDKANEYFKNLIKENFEENVADWTEQDFEECLDDGFFMDDTHFCVYINEITLDYEA